MLLLVLERKVGEGEREIILGNSYSLNLKCIINSNTVKESRHIWLPLLSTLLSLILAWETGLAS